MRAQAHTLEGVAAALLVVMSVGFALQVTAVTPLTASTANQHIGNQQNAATAGVLANADEEDALKATLLYWNESGFTFHGTGADAYYVGQGPPTSFGDMLEETFNGTGIAYNVNAVYLTPSNDRRTRRVVYFGQPSDNAVEVRRTVTLYDSDQLRGASGDPTGTTLAEASYFMPDAAPDRHLYNVVRIEVVVWRM